ncbi:MAG: hypothetical protein RLZZ196_2335 [Bacteroidota bacterium]|jgi:hypothetical protein
MSKLRTSPGVLVEKQRMFERVLSATELDDATAENFKNTMLNLDHEQDPEWQKLNLEYDLRTCDWICDKAKSNKHYAQNLYAALCNNTFRKNDVLPILQDQEWGCSWRYAGGIIAHLREEGDYLDWYCSGIKEVGYDSEKNDLIFNERQYVGEGSVTEEIREDLFKLGWLVIETNEE